MDERRSGNGWKQAAIGLTLGSLAAILLAAVASPEVFRSLRR